MRETNRYPGDPYSYDFDAACQSVIEQRGGSQMNPAVLRVPVMPGGAGINPFRVQFNVDPQDLGFEIRTLYASDFARAALERARALYFAEERTKALEKEVAALRRDLEAERLTVARFERYTLVDAETINRRYA